MILLLGEDGHPTLVAVEQYLRERECETLRAQAADLVDELTVDDVITQNRTCLRWELHGVTITNDTVQGVLNLLEYLDDGLFASFHERDRVYVQAEYHAYLAFALAEFRNVINPPWAGSLSGTYPSLPMQWVVVPELPESPPVPQAFFGRIADAPEVFRRSPNTVVSEDVYSGTYWHTGWPDDLETDDYRLLYIRPPGRPIVVSMVDEDLWATDVTSGERAGVDVRSLAPWLTSLCEAFRLRVCECLIFADSRTGVVTYGSVRPTLNVLNIAPEQRASCVAVLSRRLSGTS
jgi:hypothetical protein